jgi:hypothetical protein
MIVTVIVIIVIVIVIVIVVVVIVIIVVVVIFGGIAIAGRVFLPIEGAFIDGDCRELVKLGEVGSGFVALRAGVAIAADCDACTNTGC